MTDYAGASWMPTTHCWPNANTPRYVIIHGTAHALTQSAADVAQEYQSSNPNSMHYIVGRNGEVVQCVAESDAAWGNGTITRGADTWWRDNPNTYTVSVDHVNDKQNGSALTAQQKATSFSLIRDICRRHNIPMRPADAQGGIIGHFSIDPIDRANCPGNYPWSELWTFLSMRNADPAASGQLSAFAASGVHAALQQGVARSGGLVSGGVAPVGGTAGTAPQGAAASGPRSALAAPAAPAATSAPAAAVASKPTSTSGAAPSATQPAQALATSGRSFLCPVPLVSQLTSNTNDGQPSENANGDCVPAVVSSALMYLLPGYQVTPDGVKDAAYGQGYVGATDPDKYITFASGMGVTISEQRNTDSAALLRQAITYLERHMPVMMAIPSQWGLDYTGKDMVNFVGGTHEVLLCDWDGSQLTAMNPWPFSWTGNNGWYQTQPFDWWAQRLVYGRINPMEVTMLDLTTVSTYFAQQGADGWRCIQNGNVIQMGILNFYRSMPGAGTRNGLTALGLPLSNEFYPMPGVAAQLFERGVVVWDPDRKFDNPVGAVGQAYLGHVDDPRLNRLLNTTSNAPTTNAADLKPLLDAMNQMLSPYAQAAAQLVKVQKELGY